MVQKLALAEPEPSHQAIEAYLALHRSVLGENFPLLFSLAVAAPTNTAHAASARQRQPHTTTKDSRSCLMSRLDTPENPK